MRVQAILLVAITLVATAVAAAADTPLLSRTYKFKTGVALEIGASMENGLRLDTVEFRLPAEGRLIQLRIGPDVRAEVAISNLGSVPLKVGVAIALFDVEGRLVGAASGGSALLAIKPGRQSTYNLSFKDVNDRAAEAASFQISIEPK